MGPLEEVLLILHEIIIRFEWWGIGAEELGEMKVPKKGKCSGVLEGSKYELLEFPAFSTWPVTCRNGDVYEKNKIKPMQNHYRLTKTRYDMVNDLVVSCVFTILM